MSSESKVSASDLQSLLEVLPSFSESVQGFQHPNLSPVLFEYGAFALRWYSLAYLFGILLGYFLILFLNRKFNLKSLSEKALENLPMWVILSIIIGGRLGYILFYNFEYYANNLSQVIQVWKGGMSFHGGVLGVIIGIYLYAVFYREKYLKVTDLIAVVAPIGIFFGRMANFINQELRGKICEPMNWYSDYCVIYTGENIARFPTQILEALTEGLLLFFILFYAVTRFKLLNIKGLTSALFLMFYSCFRFSLEFFKEPDAQGYFFNYLTTGHMLTIPSFALGIIVLFFALKNNEKTATQK